MSLKTSGKYIKIAFASVLIYNFVWSVSSQSTFKDESSDQINSSSVIDPPATIALTSTERPYGGWFGGLFAPTRAVPNNSCNCTCGVANYGARIVGGKATQTNEYPWMARLLYFDRFYCGGTLINDRYVLTAAHCTKRMWFMVKVTFGEHDACTNRPSPETRYISRSISRQSIFNVIDNDIALLKLTERVPLNQFIRPVCLPDNRAATYSGIEAIVAGWGTTTENGKASCVLQQVKVPILSHEECIKDTNYQSISIVMSNNMLCAGYPQGGSDSCQGDSGGPLTVQRDDKRYEIVGVVSWGVGCARPNTPGVYTRVTKYIDWIRQNSRDGCYCQD